MLAIDLYPTLAGLAGAPIPRQKTLDGKDIWADVALGNNPHAEESIFWLRHHGGGNEVAIRRGNLKAYRKNFGKWQVFDVAEDVSESSDLAKSEQIFLGQQVSAGAAWAKTHTAPQWHDTQASLNSWIENSMPRYEETFKMR